MVDSLGNAVSNTYTLNFSYGVGLVADGTGVLLNNELDDFTAAPGASNAFGLVGFEANLPGPGKRPLSSMSPTIVLKDGKPVLVTGSPGGSRIISTVLQVIVNVLDYDMDVAAAVAAPRLHHQWLPDEVRIERGFADDVIAGAEGEGPHHDRADGPDLGQFDRRDRPRIARRARSAHPRRRSRRGNRSWSVRGIADLPDDGIGSRRIWPPVQVGRRGRSRPVKNVSGETFIMSHGRAIAGDRNRANRRHQPARFLSRHESAGAADVLGVRRRAGRSTAWTS